MRFPVMVMHAPSTLYVRIRKMNAAVDAACTAPRSRQTRLTHPSLQRGRECFRHCSIKSGTLAHRAAYALSKLYHLLGTEELRSEEHTSELQSLMRISYAVLCLKKK